MLQSPSTLYSHSILHMHDLAPEAPFNNNPSRMHCSHSTHDTLLFIAHTYTYIYIRRAARPDKTAPSSIPILLCGDFNARPPMSVDDKRGEECDYPPEAMPILLLPDKGGEEEGGLLRFRSLYDLDECVHACLNVVCSCVCVRVDRCLVMYM